MTIFSEPYNYNTPEALSKPGVDGRYKALSDAKTQHKDKTASQLGELCDLVVENYAADPSDASLAPMHDKLKGGSLDDAVALLKEFKGIGDTGASIFCRRMQADWEELFPFCGSSFTCGIGIDF